MSENVDRVVARNVPKTSERPRAEDLARARYLRIYRTTWNTFARLAGEREVQRLKSQAEADPERLDFFEFAARHIEALVLDLAYTWNTSDTPPHPTDQQIVCKFFGVIPDTHNPGKTIQSITARVLAYSQELNAEYALARLEASDLEQDTINSVHVVTDQTTGTDVVVKSIPTPSGN